jgi:putative thioredoxin
MGGAVDLAAVQARTEAAARAAQAPAPAAGQLVVEVTEASFQAEVLDRSFQLPVVIDVTSARSPASQQLSPLLDQLVAEAGGAWLLAHIDADANPRIAQALQVQALPTVFAVIGGQLVPGFEGALPEEQLRAFLQAVTQAGQEAGLAAMPSDGAAAEAELPAPELPEDPRFVAAEEAVQAGDWAAATQGYQAILAAEPGNELAKLALLQVALFARVEGLDDDVAVRADADPADVPAALAAADLAMAANDAESAFARLISALERTSGDERDAVRLRLVEYFDLLGPDDPRVAPARRAMARVLF